MTGFGKKITLANIMQTAAEHLKEFVVGITARRTFPTAFCMFTTDPEKMMSGLY